METFSALVAEQAAEHTIELPVVWDALTLAWRHNNTKFDKINLSVTFKNGQKWSKFSVYLLTYKGYLKRRKTHRPPKSVYSTK